MPTCNTTLTEQRIDEDPLWHSLTFHHLGLIISAIFGLIAVFIALFLILRHATHYLKPWEQKHIIRILFMIPIYATVSFLSYLYYRHAIYFEVIRDCYEAFAISSFFTLMCHYIAPNLHEQKDYFRTLEPKNWLWPLPWIQKCTGGQNKGILRKPQSGLTWFNVIWIAVFQYCFIRVFFTIVSVVTQATDRYCESSLHPAFAHVWVMVFEGFSVTVAMYCLIQFYYQLKNDLSPYRPFLKILCIKLVIFFSFWQSLLISFLSSDSGPLKPTKKIAYPDIKVGIPAMLICVEMSIFASMHIFAFPWKPYDKAKYQDPLTAPTSGLSGPAPTSYAASPARALVSAFNPWDIIKASARGFRWIFVGVRHRKNDISYQTKLGSLSSDTSYPTGPTFAGNGEAATEIGGGKKTGAAGGKSGFDNSDTEGLLSHAQSNPYSQQNSFSRPTYATQNSFSQAYGGPQDSFANPHSRPYNDSTSDLAAYDPDRLPAAPTPGQEYGVVGGSGRNEFEPQDTSYHSGARPTGRPHEQDLGAGTGGAWDLFAGATQPNQRPAGGGKGAPPGGMI